MIARALVLCCVISLASPKVEAALVDEIKQIFQGQSQSDHKLIKVLLYYDQPGVMLETKGRYCIFDPNTNKHISTRSVGKRKFIQPTSEGLRWGEDFSGLFQLKLVPESPQGTVIVEGTEYKGSIYIYDIHGKISVVNELPIEDYITSILTARFREPLSHEALAAIAIAARTQAHYQAAHPKTKFWSVDASHVDYEGYVMTTLNQKIEEVVKLTHNMVLSKTAAYEGIVTPFPAELSQAISEQKAKDHMVMSKLSLREMDALAENGEHAAQILTKAFPDTSIQLVN